MVFSSSPIAPRLAIVLAVVSVAPLVASARPERQPDPQVAGAARPQQLLLVSYAVTKAAYDRIIPLFTAEWQRKTGQTVLISGSYGGSGSQTRAIIGGRLEADVAGLALEGDVLKLQEAGLVRPGWQKDLPNNAVATNSTIALFTRRGNPKRIRGWKDLERRDVQVITANPATSGGAQWSFLSLWGSVTQAGGSDAEARRYVGAVLRNVPELPKDAREATDTFLVLGRGDVLLNWESEAHQARRSAQWSGEYQVPSPNILTEMPIAVVDRNVDRRGTRRVAEAFARFLFTPAAQRVFVDHGFRPVTAEGKAYARGRLPEIRPFTVAAFGGWGAVRTKFFARGGLWDQLIAARGG